MQAADQPEWIENHVYEVVDVARLRVPNELEDPECMTGRWVWIRRRLRRRAPWLVPAQKPRDCCWHHRVDWRTAAGVAVRLVRQAQAANIPGEQIGDYVMDALFDEGLGDREERAVVLLVGSGAGIMPNDEPNPGWLYHDGQHRVAAQLDQGVPQTIIQRFEDSPAWSPASSPPSSWPGPRPHAAAGWVDGSISENGTVCQYTATTSDVPPNPLWIDHTTLQTSCDNGCVWTNNPDVTFDDVAGTAVIGELDFTCTTTFGITCSYRVTNIVLYRVGTSRTYTGGPFTGTKTGGSFLCPSSVSLDSITMTFHSST